jgi:hypothetical protein
LRKIRVHDLPHIRSHLPKTASRQSLSGQNARRSPFQTPSLKKLRVQDFGMIGFIAKTVKAEKAVCAPPFPRQTEISRRRHSGFWNCHALHELDFVFFNGASVFARTRH